MIILGQLWPSFINCFVAKKMCVLFGHKNDVCTVWSQKRFLPFSVAKTVSAPRPESFCASKIDNGDYVYKEKIEKRFVRRLPVTMIEQILI